MLLREGRVRFETKIVTVTHALLNGDNYIAKRLSCHTITAIGIPSKNSIKHDMSGETELDQVRFGTTGVMLVH